MSKIYAVKNGHQTGIFDTWAECEKQVSGFSNAQFKSFSSFQLDEANAYLNDRPVTTSQSDESEELIEVTEEDIDHNDGQYHVYVDGSFANGQYAWGFVVYHNDEEIHAANAIGNTPGMETMRNVSGEITAARKAVEWAIENDIHINLYYDYSGIAAWIDESWSTNNIYTISYAMYMRDHSDYYTLMKVKGHTDVVGNERADALAKLALGIED